MRRTTLLLLILPAFGVAEADRAVYDIVFDAPLDYSPGAPAGFRVAVLRSEGPGESSPAADQPVEVRLGAATVFGGKTGPDGAVRVAFTVPDIEEGTHEMTVTAAGQEFKQSVTLKRVIRVLLTTDKPIYQPSQTIHMRAMALDAATLRPRGGEITFEVEDPKGNKVFKRRAAVSAYGIASADFELADEIALGSYRLRAGSAERAVTVRKYVLPKFSIDATFDKPFYAPGETVRIGLTSTYFFGKPVAGDVRVKAAAFDAGWREFATATGTVPRDVEIPLPQTLYGLPLERGNALVRFEIEVTDAADHAEKIERTLTVALRPLTIEVAAESGTIVPDVENTLYVAVSTPDGKPAVADVKLRLGSIELEGKTSEAGWAEFAVTPRREDLAQAEAVVLKGTATARTASGLEASEEVSIGLEPKGDNVLLRLPQATYRAGDALRATVLSTFGRGSVFIDAVRGGQTLLTLTAVLEGGRAEVDAAIPPDLFGAVELHAYVVRADGNILRDTRLICVEPRDELRVTATPDRDTYRPGEEAVIRFETDGPAALGVAIVDESVFALEEAQPGLARTYFTLEQELAQPKYQIKGGEFSTERAAISLAGARVEETRWRVNTIPDRLKRDGEFKAAFEIELARHILERHGEWRRDGAFLPDLVERVQPGLRDPWDRPYTIDRMGCSMELYLALYMRARLHYFTLNLEHYLWDHDVTVDDGLIDRMIADGALKPAQARDLDMAVIQKWLPDFTAERVETAAREIRRAGSYARLLTRMADHGDRDVEVPVAVEVSDHDVATFRRLRFRTAILKAIEEKGIGAVIVGGAYVDGIAEMLVEWGYVGPAAAAIDDRPDPALAAGTLMSGREGLIVGRICTVFHHGTGTIPAKPLEALVERGDLTAAQIRDPWGGTLRVAAGGGNGCSLFTGHVESAGPDGAFDTADDLKNLGAPAAWPPIEWTPVISYSGTDWGVARIRPTEHADRFEVIGREVLDPILAASSDDEEFFVFKGSGINDAIGIGGGGGGTYGGRFGGKRSLVARGGGANATEADSPIRVRTWFPETLAWRPELITDEHGRAEMRVPLADSITTWRLTATANALDGRLGGTTAAIRVFQDFFVDIDFPATLTQNDEIHVPVAVYNYLKGPQTVTLTVTREDWFELLGDAQQRVEMKADEVRAVYFPIRVTGIGPRNLTIEARGSAMSDAIRRSVEVVPDGRRVEQVVNGKLAGDIVKSFEVPADATACKLIFKCYPGVFSQIMEGVEGMLGAPHG